MKILITGHTGFIGRNMMSWMAAEEGWQVDGYEWHPIERPEVSSYDWVIHLGAIADMTCTDVEAVMKQNLEFSQWLFNECNFHGVNLQYASSSSVYGDTKDFSEYAPCYPQTPYAWSKYLFDRWVAKQEPAYGCHVQGFRYFNVYGNLEDHKKDQASPVTKFRKQSETGTIKLFKDSDKYLRDFVAVEDVCRTHLKFVHVAESGIWNIGTGKTVSFEHVAQLIAKKTNTQIEYIDMPDILKKGYQAYTCADLTKLTTAIGPQQWITVEDWLNS
jgi:ADP-L-glycero-D-manno-heptose 6-epimerase